jgi:hypothetical protein
MRIPPFRHRYQDWFLGTDWKEKEDAGLRDCWYFWERFSRFTGVIAGFGSVFTRTAYADISHD